ncbi:MAG: hypothetical protein Q9160_005277 [Pyrenula sp. 1 TL-2023]
MAAHLPPEIFSLIIANAHPYDLVDIACTCHMLRDLCKELLSYHKNLSMQWKRVNCTDNTFAIMNDLEIEQDYYHENVFELAATIEQNDLLPYHIRCLKIESTEDRWENIVHVYGSRIRDKLVQLASSANFSNDFDIDEWDENLKKTHEPGPIIAWLLSEVHWLKKIDIAASALANVFVLTQLRNSFLCTPQSPKPDELLAKVERLCISNYELKTKVSLSVEFLLFLPSLRRVTLDHVDFYYEAGARSPTSEVATIARAKVLQNLDSLVISGSIEVNALLYLFQKSSRLRDVWICGSVNASMFDSAQLCGTNILTIRLDPSDSGEAPKELEPTFILNHLRYDRVSNGSAPSY